MSISDLSNAFNAECETLYNLESELNELRHQPQTPNIEMKTIRLNCDIEKSTSVIRYLDEVRTKIWEASGMYKKSTLKKLQAA